jgi:hypothetical protein
VIKFINALKFVVLMVYARWVMNLRRKYGRMNLVNSHIDSSSQLKLEISAILRFLHIKRIISCILLATLVNRRIIGALKLVLSVRVFALLILIILVLMRLQPTETKRIVFLLRNKVLPMETSLKCNKRLCLILRVVRESIRQENPVHLKIVLLHALEKVEHIIISKNAKENSNVNIIISMSNIQTTDLSLSLRNSLTYGFAMNIGNL